MGAKRLLPGDPGYSGRAAIAGALRSLAEIRAEFDSAKSRAEAAHTSRVAVVARQRDAVAQAAEASRRKADAQAAKLASDIDQVSRDADVLLHQVGLNPPRVLPGRQGAPPSPQSINQVITDINEAIRELRRSVSELERVRQTLIPRLRRRLGLKP